MPSPTEGPIVTEAFRVAHVDGFNAAVRYIRSADDSRQWKTDEVRRLLARRVYLGEVGVNGNTNTEAHEPLTTLAHWTGAQTSPKARRANGEYVLSGVATCGVCGAHMTGALQHANGKTYRRMVCSSANNGKGECTGNSISAKKLEAHVHELLSHALSDVSFRLSMSHGIEEAQAAVDTAESRLEAFLEAFDTEGGATPKAFKVKADKLAHELVEAQEHYAVIAAKASQVEVLPSADQLDDPEQFARALRASVDHIEVQAVGKGARVPVEERAQVVWSC